ncbi:MAG: c-type cytochrome, partial [Opitutaceae bacterium]
IVFADKLVMPRALALVADGLLVAEPPRLLFLRDTNGDGVADQRTEIASDYGPADNPEHSANGLLWAMDNWIYSAKHNVRFRWEDGGKFSREATIPRGQWGIAQDDAGRIFYNTNSDPLRYDAIPSAYLKRNPNFAATGTNAPLVPGNLRIWPGRVTAGVNRGYQILNAEGKLNAMTAASGPVIYRGALFPAEFRGDAFVPEPSGNLIKRIKLTDKDGRLTGANAYEGTEFMTSTDERFRPVNLYNGPDGALYVVDLYRGIIQHRVFMTTFLRKQVEERGLDKGLGRGRIWRIVPDSASKANFDSGLARASTVELVAKLGDANGWVRDTAQRMLAEKRDATTQDAVRKAAANSEGNAVGRVHALWALEGSDGLDRASVLSALDAKDARVATAAVRLAEKFLGEKNRDSEIMAKTIALGGRRAEPDVRLQLALTLPEIRTPAADEALRALVVAAGRQQYLADAVVSGMAGREEAFVAALARDPKAEANAGDAIRFATSAVLKSGDAARIDRVLTLAGAEATPEWARTALLGGVRHFLPRTPDGRGLAGSLPAEPKPLLALAEKSGAPSATVARQLLAELRWPGKPGMVTVAVRPLNAREQAAFERGKTQYAALCVACHQPNGQGQAGLAPPLVNSRWALSDPRIVARVVLNGKARENLIMPPWKTLLDDEAIAGVLTFVRRSWGHEADPVATAVVAEARAATANRDTPYTEEALLELQEEFAPSTAKK